RGQRNNWQTPELRISPYHLHRLISVHLGHHDVHQNNTKIGRRIDRSNGLTSSSGGQYHHSTALQNTAERKDVSNVVIDDQDLASDQRFIGPVQAIQHLLFLDRKV